MKRLCALIALGLSAVLVLSGCAQFITGPQSTEATEPTSPQSNVTGKLTCVEISRFSGRFVEDGSDRQVSEVAAILVANDTGEFVDLATITYTVGEKTATFRVTGLASGERAWVLEQNAMQIAPEEELVFDDCVVSYNPDPIVETSDLKVSRNGHALTLTNTTDQTLVNVCVYYKNRMEDGMFMGGITYQMIFNDLAPGQTVTLSRDHFVERSEIVRFSYQVK